MYGLHGTDMKEEEGVMSESSIGFRKCRRERYDIGLRWGTDLS